MRLQSVLRRDDAGAEEPPLDLLEQVHGSDREGQGLRFRLSDSGRQGNRQRQAEDPSRGAGQVALRQTDWCQAPLPMVDYLSDGEEEWM